MRRMRHICITEHYNVTQLGMCRMDFSSSVWFWEKPRVRFWKNRRFGFLCRSVVKYKNVYDVCLVCAFCILVNGFLNAQLVSNACFLKLNFHWRVTRLVTSHFGAAPNYRSGQTNKRQCYHNIRNKYSKPTARAMCDQILLLLQRC